MTAGKLFISFWNICQSVPGDVPGEIERAVHVRAAGKACRRTLRQPVSPPSWLRRGVSRSSGGRVAFFTSVYFLFVVCLQADCLVAGQLALTSSADTVTASRATVIVEWRSWTSSKGKAIRSSPASLHLSQAALQPMVGTPVTGRVASSTMLCPSWLPNACSCWQPVGPDV
jgi:hypothetical protein